MYSIEIATKILERAKQEKIKYCTENGLPIPDFTKEEDFILGPIRPIARWNQFWKCSYCGYADSFSGRGCLPDSCPCCGAFMTNT